MTEEQTNETTEETTTEESSGVDLSEQLSTLTQRLEQSIQAGANMESKLTSLQGEYDKIKQERTDLLRDKADTGDKAAKSVLKQEELDSFQGKIDEKDKEIEKLQSLVHRFTVTDKVISEIGSKFSDTSFARKALTEEINRHARWDGDLDNGQVVFQDGQGNPLMSKDRINEPMGIGEFGNFLTSQLTDIVKSEHISTKRSSGEVSRANGSVTLEQFRSMSRDERNALPKNVRVPLRNQLLNE